MLPGDWLWTPLFLHPDSALAHFSGSFTRAFSLRGVCACLRLRSLISCLSPSHFSAPTAAHIPCPALEHPRPASPVAMAQLGQPVGLSNTICLAPTWSLPLSLWGSHSPTLPGLQPQKHPTTPLFFPYITHLPIRPTHSLTD